MRHILNPKPSHGVLLSLLWTTAACSGGVPLDDAAQDFQTTEESSEESPEASVDTAPSSAEAPQILTQIELSDTHTITFTELAPGQVAVTEMWNADLENSTGVTLDDPEITLTELYEELAQGQVDPSTLARLEAHEEMEVTEASPSEAALVQEAEPFDPATTPSPAALPDLVNKDARSDAIFFAGKHCLGCLGFRGQPWTAAPGNFSVCGTTLQNQGIQTCVTETDVSGSYTYPMTTSLNLSLAAFNQHLSDTARVRVVLDDPCQWDSWWSRLTSVCRKPALAFGVDLAPRFEVSVTLRGTKAWRRITTFSGSRRFAFKMAPFSQGSRTQ